MDFGGYLEIIIVGLISALVFIKLDKIKRWKRITLFIISFLSFIAINSYNRSKSNKRQSENESKIDSLLKNNVSIKNQLNSSGQRTDTIFIVSNQIYDAVKGLSNKNRTVDNYYGDFHERAVDKRVFNIIKWYIEEYADNDKPGFKRKIYAASLDQESILLAKEYTRALNRIGYNNIIYGGIKSDEGYFNDTVIVRYDGEQRRSWRVVVYPATMSFE